MSHDADIAHLAAALQVPGLRYRSFGNQAVRKPGEGKVVAPGPALQAAAIPPQGSAIMAEQLSGKRPPIQNPVSPADAPEQGSRTEPAKAAPLPPRMMQAQPASEARHPEAEMGVLPPAIADLSAALAGRLAVAPPASSLPSVPAPLGGAASLLAALRAAEARRAPAAGAEQGLLAQLSAASTGPTPSPLLATLAPHQPPPARGPVPTLLGATPSSAAPEPPPIDLAGLLRMVGQPPAPAGQPAAAPEAVPEVLRSLRLTGLG